jgi:hypothetical protein
LRDEDDLGKQLVMDHPTWTMPRIYKEFNRQLANTAYQTNKMPTHEYRSDWIEFPRRDSNGKSIRDKQARRGDICSRTYESVRQHLEKHKTMVNNFNIVKPFTWDPLEAENLAARLPKRDPPPRPTYFKDGTTPVNPLDEETVSEDNPAEDASAAVGNSSGWTPINKRFGRTYTPIESSPVPIKKRRAPKAKAQKEVPQINTSLFANPFTFMQPQTPADPGHLRSLSNGEDRRQDDDNAWMNSRPPVEQSAPGDALYDDLYQFVMDQSDGAGDDDDRVQQSGLGDHTALALAPVLSRLPPLPVSNASGLPAGWDSRRHVGRGQNNGRTYYLDFKSRRTTWMSPNHPAFREEIAFSGGNVLFVPRSPTDGVRRGNQFMRQSDAGLPTTGSSAAINDLAIAHLPSQRPTRVSSASAVRRATTTTSTRTHRAVGPTNTPRSAVAPISTRRRALATTATAAPTAAAPATIAPVPTAPATTAAITPGSRITIDADGNKHLIVILRTN